METNAKHQIIDNHCKPVLAAHKCKHVHWNTSLREWLQCHNSPQFDGYCWRHKQIKEANDAKN